MRLARLVALGAGAVTVALGVASCLDATQMTVVVRTDLRCDQTRGTSFFAAGGDLRADALPVTSTPRCSANGEIGTLVVTPEKSKSTEVSLRVVMGVDRPVEACAAPDYKGCIVQRRRLSYVPHRPLTIPVYMLLSCVGVPCDESTTCAANGQCVSARIDDPESCIGDGCFPKGDPSGQPDASPPTPPGPDATADAQGPDGTAADAGGDATTGPDGSIADSGIRCPNQSAGREETCFPAMDNVCCASFAFAPFQARCASGQECSQGMNQTLLRCTSSADCQPGELCCALGSQMQLGQSATCKPAAACGAEQVVCVMSAPVCPAGKPMCGMTTITGLGTCR